MSDESNVNPMLEDHEILSAAKSLAKTLNISIFKFNPYRVYWTDSKRVVLADLCNADPSRVTLPKDLIGKLSPHDWKALLASGLLYRYKVKGLQKQLLVVGFLPIAFAFMILIFPQFLAESSWFASLQCAGNVCAIILGLFYPVYIAAAITTVMLVAPYLRSSRLKADSMASELVNSETLLSAFRKALSINARSLERLKKRRSRFSFEPTLSERIENLLDKK